MIFNTFFYFNCNSTFKDSFFDKDEFPKALLEFPKLKEM